MGRGKQDLSKKAYKVHNRVKYNKDHYRKRCLSKLPKLKKKKKTRFTPPRTIDWKKYNRSRNSPTWSKKQALSRRQARFEQSMVEAKKRKGFHAFKKASLKRQRYFLRKYGNYNVESMKESDIESIYARVNVLWQHHKAQGRKKKTFLKALVSFFA